MCVTCVFQITQVETQVFMLPFLHKLPQSYGWWMKGRSLTQALPKSKLWWADCAIPKECGDPGEDPHGLLMAQEEIGHHMPPDGVNPTTYEGEVPKSKNKNPNLTQPAAGLHSQETQVQEGPVPCPLQDAISKPRL